MPVGCSRFSWRCYLIIVLNFIFNTEVERGPSRSRLNSAVELGCSVQTLFYAGLLYATALIAFWLLRSGSYSSPLTYNG